MSPRLSYAVSWREDDGPQCVGKLDLRRTFMRLEGRGPGCSEVGHSVRYAELAGVAGSRTEGYRSTVLVQLGGSRIVITSLDRPGALAEIESELRTRTKKPHRESGAVPMTADA